MKTFPTTLLLLASCLSVFTVNAQRKELSLSSKANADKSVTLTAEKNTLVHIPLY